MIKKYLGCSSCYWSDGTSLCGDLRYDKSSLSKTKVKYRF
jgi:hypothetical protein